MEDSPPAWLKSTIVVIPALNEQASISQTILEWRSLGASHIRVVDNGSTDQTATISAKAGAEVLFEPARGYGAAAWKGLQNWPVNHHWVLFSSADGSDHLAPGDLPRWTQAIEEGAELLVGDRTGRESSRAHLKPVQRLGNWITCAGLRLGWGHSFQDMGSLRLVRIQSLVAMNLQDRGFGWNIEMQVRAIELGIPIAEIPVDYRPRNHGVSKISGTLVGSWKAGSAIVQTLAALWFQRGKTDRRNPG